MRLLIGTRAGLFLLRGMQGWKRVRCSGPLLTRRAAGPLTRMPVGGVLAAVGDTLHASADGARWRRLGTLPKGLRFWSLAAAGDTLYAGTEPAALLRSHDGGRTWREIAGLRGHPTAPEWWGPWRLPLAQAVVADLRHPSRLYVAISVAGIFRGDDDESWEPCNEGIAPIYPRAARQRAVHRDVQNLTALPPQPDASDAATVLIAATSHGLYRRQVGHEWEQVSDSWASSGVHALAVARGQRAVYAVPHPGAAGDQRASERAVWRSLDGGLVWQPLPATLPNGMAARVHRDALAVCESAPSAPPVLYLGTRDGTILWSTDSGDRWQLLARDLPSIHALLPLPDDGETREPPHHRWPFGWG